ncbi:hypothetical protein GQ55_7G293400 [Panicum hallii var. hallii]|uniref:Uncharacterized protein n=1 Tax=Panicum hallii var. hallii TaxID=1504633 RepID=A0A2T7D0D3_9POAL|nr:hypothetical protein GQ55_7G293400 [Panicum hallii var. hallii]
MRSYRVMPPLFPSSCNNGFEDVDGRDKRSQPEEEGFSHPSERAVYEEYLQLQSIHRECGEQDLSEEGMSVTLHKHQVSNLHLLTTSFLLNEMHYRSLNFCKPDP